MTFHGRSSSERTGLLVRSVHKGKVLVAGPSEVEPVRPDSAHSDMARNKPARGAQVHRSMANSGLDQRVPGKRVPTRRVPGRSVQDRRNSMPASRHRSQRGKKTIAPTVGLVEPQSGRRASKSGRRSLDRSLRAPTSRRVDLHETAVLMAVAPSRKSRGRNAIPKRAIVRTVPHSNHTPDRAVTLPLNVKKSGLPDPPG